MVAEVITTGHVVNPGRLSLIQERSQFSDYLIIPTKFSFQSIVRIYGYVMTFITNCKARCRQKKLLGPLLCTGDLKFTAFSCVEVGLVGEAVQLAGQDDINSEDRQYKSLVMVFTCSLNPDFVEKYKGCHTETQGVPVLTDRFLNMALTYLFRNSAPSLTTGTSSCS